MRARGRIAPFFRLRPPTPTAPDEAGVAMIIAVMVMLLLTLIPIAMFGEALQQLPLARHDQDHESALHAAEAGLEDYINHLNANNNYWFGGNVPSPPDGNPAFTAWVPVPGPTTTESFRYTVDISSTPSSGVVYVTSSGRSCAGSAASCAGANPVVRTVKVGLRKSGFLDYLYLTDYEIVDPALSGESTTSCRIHAWEKNPSGGFGPDLNQCSPIFMTNQASFVGPVHTNDGFYVCGNPNFSLAPVDTYYNTATDPIPGRTNFGGPGAYLNPNQCSNNPTFRPNSTDPLPGQNLQLPPANSSLQVVGALTGAAGGCLFTGPTTIALHYTGNNGFFDVTSPSTKSINPSCVTAAQVALLGQGKTVTGLALPPNGVIYVQTIPSSTSDANHSSCSGTGCLGDVNVSNATTAGGLAGQLTIGADDNIIITGNLTYHSYPGGTDILGLIALNNVAINHPVDDRGNNATGFLTNPVVDAAILTLKHSFYVPNWSQGATMGTLTVNGSISQEYRGPVGTFNGSSAVSGYTKVYTYDGRLKYLTPPYFLNPLLSAWSKLSFAELKPAF